MADTFTDTAQVERAFASDPVLTRLLLTHPLAGGKHRGIRVDAVFSPESEITLNADKYAGSSFSCIVALNDETFYAVGRSATGTAFLSEIDHSVVYGDKVIFAGVL